MRYIVFLLTMSAAWAQSPVDFGKQVEPLLRSKCQACHGAAQQISGLRLDNKQAAMAGGYAGPAIVPGKSDQSKLMDRLVGAKGLMRMPPGNPLTTVEIATIRSWIDQGAVWPESAQTSANPTRRSSSHWAFQPVRSPAPPTPKRSSWVRNSIDSFVLAKLESEGVAPSPEASRRTLLRRVSLDLTGLLPTPGEMQDFLSDQRPDAYERLVDRLLDSPHYGERWARPWLDRARYADSDGYEKDWMRPYAWRYRHWVIEALNRDMPFDKFTRDQLAGDLIPGAGVEQKVATGFLRMTMTNREGGVDNKQFQFENTVDRVVTLGATWMGLTLGCTQCHDHKYDPISQKDFYQLYAFFDHVDEVEDDAPMPGELGPYIATKDAYRAKREELLKEYRVADLQSIWEKELLQAGDHPGERTDWDLAWSVLITLTEGGDGEKILRTPVAKRSARERDILTDHFIRNYHFAVGQKPYNEVKFKELDEKLRKLKDDFPQLTQAMVVTEPPGAKPSYLRVRGDFRSLGIAVKPEVPSVLPPLRSTKASRLDLADWLTSNDNPLTSRVTVNWVWAELFGRGLVKTVDDFGTRGESPTHPELLDYLARRFMDNGWSMKQIVREIVLSNSYRQASTVRQDLKDRDPDNALIARQARLRLPAELIRDAALRASGLISLEVGGKSMRPPIPDGVMELGYGNRWGVAWPVSKGSEKYRRGLYVHFQRSTPYPMLMNFDAPKSNVAQCKRERSNSPLQALNLLNDPVFHESAQGLGYLAMNAGSDWDKRLETAFLHTLSRLPGDTEKQKLERYFASQKQLLAKEGVADESAAWTALASVLLNLDEFLTRE
ncbi:MAG: PSD1 domain-containing protein [Acidobacteria bacterium]|nr:PSD1 domain-containing protein [Acidobacteriota bacterium]